MGIIPGGRFCNVVFPPLNGLKSTAAGGKVNLIVVEEIVSMDSLKSRIISVIIPLEPFARSALGAMLNRTIAFIPMANSILCRR